MSSREALNSSATELGRLLLDCLEPTKAGGRAAGPERIIQRDSALDRGCRHDLTLSGGELVTQLGHALLELMVARRARSAVVAA